MVVHLALPIMPRIARMNYSLRKAPIPTIEWKSALLLVIKYQWVLLSGLRKAFKGYLHIKLRASCRVWRCHGSSENKKIGEVTDMS